MQLAPGERSILSYFPTSTVAERAAEALKNAGIGEIQVDRVSRFGAEIDEHVNTPINNSTTITGPTIFSSANRFMDDDVRVLLGADPSVSGYGDTDYGVAGRKGFLVTIVTNEKKLDQAVEIIEQHGGIV